MVVKTVGNPPSSADDLRENIEQQLPEIMASFNQILQEQFGFQAVRVGGFTVVPADAAASGISCNEESCSIAEDKA